MAWYETLFVVSIGIFLIYFCMANMLIMTKWGYEGLFLDYKMIFSKIFNKNDIDGIIEFTKTRAKRTVVTKETIRQPFIIAAIILLLIEIFIRRITRKD